MLKSVLAKSTGTKLISAGGNINKPGVFEIDMAFCGGVFVFG